MWRTSNIRLMACSGAVGALARYGRFGSGVTANVLVPGGAADTRLVPRAMAPDRSQPIPPEVMVAPLVWLCSNGSDGINGQRFIAPSPLER
jgi:hypothetical protein